MIYAIIKIENKGADSTLFGVDMDMSRAIHLVNTQNIVSNMKGYDRVFLLMPIEDIEAIHSSGPTKISDLRLSDIFLAIKEYKAKYSKELIVNELANL